MVIKRYKMLFRQPSSDAKEEKNKNSVPMVKLKNGSEVPKPVVVTTMMSLEALMEKNPIAFYELVEKARNPKHPMFGNTQDVVAKWALIDLSGVIHSAVRDVILSAVSGDELDMRLGNPVALENEAKNDSSKKSSEQNKYFIARPLDRFGNTLGPMAIIEAEIIEKSKYGGTRIKVIAPKEIAEKWPTFNTEGSSLVQVSDSYGPARTLTFKEHQALWQKYLKESGPEVEARESEALKRSPFNY